MRFKRKKILYRTFCFSSFFLIFNEEVELETFKVQSDRVIRKSTYNTYTEQKERVERRKKMIEYV